MSSYVGIIKDFQEFISRYAGLNKKFMKLFGEFIFKGLEDKIPRC